jgi:hypothetical protein
MPILIISSKRLDRFSHLYLDSSITSIIKWGVLIEQVVQKRPEDREKDEEVVISENNFITAVIFSQNGINITLFWWDLCQRIAHWALEQLH